MSITAAKVRAPLMRLCAAPVVPGSGWIERDGGAPKSGAQ